MSELTGSASIIDKILSPGISRLQASPPGKLSDILDAEANIFN
jgi:hypothetical protein